DPISQSNRASPIGRSRFKNRSSRAPMRSATIRLKLRTCRTALTSIISDYSQRLLQCQVRVAGSRPTRPLNKRNPPPSTAWENGRPGRREFGRGNCGLAHGIIHRLLVGELDVAAVLLPEGKVAPPPLRPDRRLRICLTA